MAPHGVRMIAPDQTLTLEGGAREAAIGVIAGLLRCFRVTPDGRRHVVRFARPGDVIGLGSQTAFRITTEAVAASTIAAFRIDAIDAACARSADVRDAVLHAMTAEVTARDRAQFRLGRLWADERVADFLQEVAYATGACKGREGILRMSRADIADHLGITIETVSRALASFQKRGLIRLDDPHRFAILRPHELEALALGDSEGARGVSASERSNQDDRA